MLWILPPLFPALDFLYFLEAVMPSPIDTATSSGRLVPGIGTGQVARPKRPNPALVRPNRINHTSFLPLDFLQKYTIFVIRVFDNRCPQAVALQELTTKLCRRHLQKICDYPDLRPGDPDISFPRPGAAPAARHALKMKTTNIPRHTITINHPTNLISATLQLGQQILGHSQMHGGHYLLILKS